MTTATAAVSLSSPVFSSPRFFRTPLLESLTQEKAKKGNEEKSDAANVKNRKSPAMLCIPVANMELELGNEMEKGVEEVEVEVEGDGYSVYSRKGKRARCLEDIFSAFIDVEGSTNQAFFGVFDGQGGAKAAEFAAKRMDANIREEITRSGSDIQKAIRNAYLKTGEEFLRRYNDDDGGVAEAITSVHWPSLNSERERNEDDGSYVNCCNGVWRILGSLAVSRSIGDRHLKRWVIAEPETSVLPITRQSEFLILASDSLWERVMNQEAVDVVLQLLIGDGTLHSCSTSKQLAELSLRRGSRDDVTVMIVELGRFIS